MSEYSKSIMELEDICDVIITEHPYELDIDGFDYSDAMIDLYITEKEEK